MMAGGTLLEALHDANLQAKSAYLNVPFFLARAVFYFLIWTFFAWRLSRWSAEQDRLFHVPLP